MKATVDYLWDTHREIISFDNDEFERPTSISELKKCDNVLVGDKIPHVGYEVLIDDQIYIVSPVKLRHFGGSMLALEVM